MDGFSERLHQQVEASLRSNVDGPPSLMMVHMQMLQERKDAEAAVQMEFEAREQAVAEEEERRQRKKSKKGKKEKSKKEKKLKKSSKKKRRSSSSSSSSDSDSGAEGAAIRSMKASGGGGARSALIEAAMELERNKVADLKRKEEERRASREAKRRRKEEDSMRSSEVSELASDAARLAAWKASEEDKEWFERSRTIMEAPPDPANPPLPTKPHAMSDDGAEDGDGEVPAVDARRSIPLSYFSRDRHVAWEYPAPSGHGTCFAPLIGVAAGDDSADEW